MARRAATLARLGISTGRNGALEKPFQKEATFVGLGCIGTAGAIRSGQNGSRPGGEEAIPPRSRDVERDYESPR